MKLEQLRILRYIVEHGSLKAAAMALHKTQPALSIAIKNLEDEFGFQILDRSQYRLKLTPQGKTFYREAEILLANAKHLTLLGKQLSQGNEAKFNICYEQVCPENRIIPAINKTYQTFSATEFNLHSGLRFSALEQVKNGEVDIGIGPWFHLFHAQGEFDTLRLGEFEIIPVISPTLLKTMKISRYEQLLRLPNIAMPESKFQFDSEKLAYNHSSKQFKVNDALTLKALLVSGVGWGFIPSHHIEQELASGTLKHIELMDKECRFSAEIRVIRQEKRHHGPVSEFLWQQLQSK
ncbi:LysR family transcriptional regulator [Colwelliaceae bacterium 6471]